ncbi:Hypothetical protein AA314_09478 [Archangium gephyra]|uniref:Uncharacterized protein n=1 Tax=Archangium gephyra TaxID=48 RepID=A0AAC8QHK1_9BACT|nr:Hypothetical protein AA314_09478 [Archangium gephyra]
MPAYNPLESLDSHKVRGPRAPHPGLTFLQKGGWITPERMTGTDTRGDARTSFRRCTPPLSRRRREHAAGSEPPCPRRREWRLLVALQVTTDEVLLGSQPA